MDTAAIQALPCWRNEVRVEPLAGGITNENFRVTDGDAAYAVRAGVDQPELGIRRDAELACARLAARIGVAPRVVLRQRPFLVTEFVPGETLTPETASAGDRLVRIARTLWTIHAAGPIAVGHLPYFSPFLVARTYLEIAASEELALPGDGAEIGARVAELEATISPFLPTFCHNDLMPGNLLDTGDKVWVIDWEYGGFAHPVFDLAGFSSNCELDAAADAELLAAYRAAGGTVDAGEFGVFKAMAALRESLWAVVQGARSELDFDYAAYRDDSYARFEREWERRSLAER